MGGYTQKYKYGAFVVEVFSIRENAETKTYTCLVRGFGHGNHAPRKEYTIDAETNAKASRIAIQRYKEEINRDGKENS